MNRQLPDGVSGIELVKPQTATEVLAERVSELELQLEVIKEYMKSNCNGWCDEIYDLKPLINKGLQESL